MSLFDQPGGGGFFKPAEHNGHLILVTAVHETFMRHDELAGREKLHARIDYVCLDCQPQELVESALTSHPGIAMRLQSKVGKRPVLGRIGQAPSKTGQPAWILDAYKEGVDDKAAETWLTAHRGNSISQPGTTATTPPAAANSAPPAPAQGPSNPLDSLTDDQRAAMAELGVTLPG